MSLCPFAVHRLLPENDDQAAIIPRKLIFHSAVDGAANTVYHYFLRADIKAESHFYVRKDGVIEQYMDTNVMAHANVKADVDAISVETDDDGDPDQQPWTPQQMDAMIRLGKWCLQEHPGILPQVIPISTGAGIGYHSMFRRPDGTSPWSNARGKTCPGAIRIAQFPQLVDGIISGEEPMQKDMLIWQEGGDGTVYVTDFWVKQKVNKTQMDLLLFFGVAIQHENGLPFAFTAEQMNSIPTVEFDVTSVDVRSIVRQELDKTKLTG